VVVWLVIMVAVVLGVYGCAKNKKRENGFYLLLLMFDIIILVFTDSVGRCRCCCFFVIDAYVFVVCL